MDETKLLGNAIAALEKKIINCRELPEKQALLFYRDELKKLCPCPEDEQFRRRGKASAAAATKWYFKSWSAVTKKTARLLKKAGLKP